MGQEELSKVSNYIIIAYYTIGTPYEGSANSLRESLRKLAVPHYIQGVPNLGTWHKNTNYKPTFVKEMLNKFKPLSVIYVDCDAIFYRKPVLFESMASDPSVNVGVHLFDRSCYKFQGDQRWEVLSGTIFFKNNDTVMKMVERWEKECRDNPKTFDQKSLEKVLNGNFTQLPAEYCKIFDRHPQIKDPVIVHYQASRKVRRKEWDVEYI